MPAALAGEGRSRRSPAGSPGRWNTASTSLATRDPTFARPPITWPCSPPRSTWPGSPLDNKEWQQLGPRALHRLAAEKQTVDGYWGEFTDNGPAVGYNYIHRWLLRRPVRGAQPRPWWPTRPCGERPSFHKHFTWPDGTPVETIDGRNRHRGSQPLGPVRLLALAGRPPLRRIPGGVLQRQENSPPARWAGSRRAPCTITRVSTEPIPQELPRFAYQMKVPAGIRKTGTLDRLPLRTDRRAGRQSVHARAAGSPEHLSRAARADRQRRRLQASARTGHFRREVQRHDAARSRSTAGCG